MLVYAARNNASQFVRQWSRGLTDEAIAKAARMLPIAEVAQRIGVDKEHLVPYGHHKAKVLPQAWENGKRPGKLILVTAITPTKAGEGKTTTSVGLCDGLNRLGKNCAVALREPSLGPVFGMKGGAAGGGYAQVVPMDEINLHFTGDFHAIGAAHNLLSAVVDNHLYWKKTPELDSRRVAWRRVVDMNDRALRSITVGLGGANNGYAREDGFDITVASEVMAIFCLARDLEDLQTRLGNIIVGYTRGSVKNRKPIYAKDLNVAGAMTALLKDALQPNLVQTLEGNPAFVHGGPFANIAHGCNSLIATRAALQLSDYVITEAGFGADLGAEKFFDIKCQVGGLQPSVVVVVATVRALKLHGGASPDNLATEDVGALVEGMANLERHLCNLRKFGVPVVVCVNKFPSDTEAELDALESGVAALDAVCVVSDHWANGGAGAVPAAQAVLRSLEQPCTFKPLYDPEASISQKLNKIAKEIYRADGVHFGDEARQQLAALESDARVRKFPICVAKTQYSFSDDAKRLNAPDGHILTVRELRLCNGAEFIVAVTGNIMTMPGLPKTPSAELISVRDGEISGLF